ncbi:MAG: porin [Hyphomicrobiales bacterium]
MKKSILLGSAAALVAVTGAQAADLPVVEPVDYVKVCDAFGAGFHYIPGTETCLKFSGRVRAEIGVRGGEDFVEEDETTYLNSNFELVVNASSMTEVGMLVGQFAISGSNEGTVGLGDAWISIGENILVGRETSRFDFGGGYGIFAGLYEDEALNQFTFIMPFGNGVSMTLGLEDGRDRRVAIAVQSTTGSTFSSTGTYGGMEIPDVVASLRVSQGWGSAQISGALHQIRADSDGVNDDLDEDFGFAIQAGAELNVGAMTKIKVVGGYADGALHYVGGGNAPVFEATMNIATNTITDTLEGWYVLAGLSHDFSDQLNIGVTGSYHDFEDQLETWNLGATVAYEVVDNLTVSVAAQYTDVEFDNTPALNVNGGETDTWEARLRVQRDF